MRFFTKLFLVGIVCQVFLGMSQGICGNPIEIQPGEVVFLRPTDKPHGAPYLKLEIDPYGETLAYEFDPSSPGTVSKRRSYFLDKLLDMMATHSDPYVLKYKKNTLLFTLIAVDLEKRSITIEPGQAAVPMWSDRR